LGVVRGMLLGDGLPTISIYVTPSLLAELLDIRAFGLALNNLRCLTLIYV